MMLDNNFLLALISILLVIVLMVLRRLNGRDDTLLVTELKLMQEKIERLERDLRYEISESSRTGRQELQQSLNSFQQSQAEQMGSLQKHLGDTLSNQIRALSESNAQRLQEVRHTLDAQLLQLQQTNAAKLDEMRKTVDEKLQSTLEARLSESFKQVADRLEQVHQGLGQMQSLAQGVGDLQRVLTNVKTRGIFGEVQLEALLEQVLTPEQYAKQVETRPRSNQRVDFAIRFPGRGGSPASPCGCPWMPNFRAKITSACWRRTTGPTLRPPSWPPKPWSRAFAAKRAALPRTTWHRRTPPTLRFCFCPSRACMPRCCAAQA
jgi:DNA recombination protein RmuC